MFVPAFLSTNLTKAFPPREGKLMLLAVVLLVLVALMLFLNWRAQASSKDKGHVSDSWLAANRASNRTGD